MKSRNVSGQISKALLVLAVVVLIVIGMVFLVIKLASLRSAKSGDNNNETSTTETKTPEPVYTLTTGDIKFTFVSAVNLGTALMPANQFGQGISTTERFIEITVTAQNKGKNNTAMSQWDLGNIIDSEGRNFVARTDAANWLPRPNLCGAILKPEFTPTKCVKIYDVSNQSKGLKIQVENNVTAVKGQSFLLDIKL